MQDGMRVAAAASWYRAYRGGEELPSSAARAAVAARRWSCLTASQLRPVASATCSVLISPPRPQQRDLCLLGSQRPQRILERRIQQLVDEILVGATGTDGLVRLRERDGGCRASQLIDEPVVERNCWPAAVPTESRVPESDYSCLTDSEARASAPTISARPPLALGRTSRARITMGWVCRSMT